MIVSIDPGLNGCGCAVFFKDGTLANAYYKPNPGKNWHSMAEAVIEEKEELVIELPRVYVRARSKGDPEDLIQLAGLVGAICMRSGNYHIVRPAEWKGQTPKEVMTKRIQSKLTAEELASAKQKLPTKSLQHNVWDAIGIGLHHVGRL